ncbi:MAG: MoaD/ThiS family protein [Saprospiraceae bacterium]|nr:MoaD/ThiS family protein [Saprospiraceae bacterium]MBK7809710.1 MoaD/ThiS family protein [Saprospiraceae bacterium]MBK9632180.1 MoaD/ThiS family protein [Saprospiraceae bacterium]
MEQALIRLMCFGMLEEITGFKERQLIGKQDTDQFRIWLNDEFPELQKIDFVIAVNRKLINQNTVLKNEDEVALLPPFSGG